MEAKKNPKYATYKLGGIFFNLGLILSISFVLVAFDLEFQAGDEVNKTSIDSDFDDELVPVTEIPEPQPPKPKVMAREFIETTELEIKIEDFEIIIDQEEVLEFIPTEQVVYEPEEEIIEEVYLVVEEMPHPYGGYTEFYNYVSNNISYPPTARRLGLEGRVFVKFVVDKHGKLIDFEVVKLEINQYYQKHDQ